MKKEKFAILLLLAVLASFAHAGAADPAPISITLDQAVATAIENNPGLKAAKAQVGEALFAYKSAGALPPLTLSGNYAGGTNNIVTNNGEFQDFNLNLSQTFGPINSIALSGKAAFQGYLATESGYEEAELSLRQSAQDAFYALLAAQEQRRVAQENLRLALRLYTLTRTQYTAGAVPQTDLVSAQIQEASARQAVIQAAGTQEQAQAALNALLGFPSSQPTQASGHLQLQPLSAGLPDLILLARETRPAIQSAEETVEQAQTEVKVAESQRNPTPSASFDQDLTTRSLYLFGVSLSFPIFDYGQIGNQVEVQKKTVTEKQNSLKQTLLTVDSSVRSAYAAYQSAYQQSVTFQEDVLNQSEKLMRMTRFGYIHGALPYLQVLVAEQNLKSARAQYISLLLSGHQAMDALEAAVGKSLNGEKP